MGLTHLDEAERAARERGHLKSTWTFLGEAAGCVGVGLRRIELAAGGWSTPAHVHGREEEIFFVLDGRGLSWQDGKTYEIAAGDCIVHRPGGEAHTLYTEDVLDVLAFGLRSDDEATYLPRAGVSWLGPRWVVSGGEKDHPWAREAGVGAPELPPEPSPRPSSIVGLADAEADREGHGRFQGEWRDLGRTAGSVKSGLKHVVLGSDDVSCPQHCHSAEEEIFVILDGEGILWLGDDELPVRAGHVVARPPATRIAHAFRGGRSGLTYLAYGTREPNDICYYPRSSKVYFRGVGLMTRLERLDYWDGED